MDNEKDLKAGEAPAGGGQPAETAPAGPTADELAAKLKEAEEEKVKLEEKNKQLESDRDNYREGLLALKAKKTTLTPEDEPEETPKPVPKDDEDEAWKRVEKLAETKAREVMDKREKGEILQNERVAIKMFLKTHPELIDDGLREAVVAEYANRNGKSVEGITLDLERAYKFYKIEHETPAQFQDNSAAAHLAAMPTGAPSQPPKTTSDELNNAMKEFGVTPETFKAFKEKVLKGEMSVPESVYNLIKSS